MYARITEAWRQSSPASVTSALSPSDSARPNQTARNASSKSSRRLTSPPDGDVTGPVPARVSDERAGS